MKRGLLARSLLTRDAIRRHRAARRRAMREQAAAAAVSVIDVTQFGTEEPPSERPRWSRRGKRHDLLAIVDQLLPQQGEKS